ncbi:MAG: carbohydrate kinase family protein [Candidatus Latescibacteria bacterium]|nr:carbohydrate kinase family protein [Candidatus Latescibacterota bacterium]
MKDVVGLGALNLDLIYRVPEDLFPGNIQPGIEVLGETEQLESILQLVRKVGKLEDKSGGGSAANTILALSRMGFDTGYVGKIGNDPEGSFLLKSLKGVDTSKVRNGKQTGVCISLLSESGERALLIFPHSNDCLTYNEVDMEYIANTRFLHLSSFAGDTPFCVQRRVVEDIPPGLKVSFDPGEFYARRGLEQLLPFLKRSFVVFLTRKEVELLTGEHYKAGCRKLLEYGPEVIVCKLAERGSYVLSAEQEIQTPAEQTEVVDKTGAGDVFDAGFLTGLLLEKPLEVCAFLANKAAALSLTAPGRQNYPDKDFLARALIR